MNAYDEPRAVVEKFIREKKLKQKVLLEGRKTAAEKYGVDAFPTSFLIDRAGKAVDREVGFAPSMAAAIEAKLEELVKERTAASEPAPAGQ